MLSNIDQFRNLTILVVGDLMLDEYVVGKNYRMSDEAPIPILKVDKFEVKLGAAANVANNLKSLGCNVFLCGTIGLGYSAERFLDLLKSRGLSHDSVVASAPNLTTTKTRILINNQQIARYDYENINLEDKVIEDIYHKLSEISKKDIDLIIVSDYNKGVICDITMNIIKAFDKPIIVDPKPVHADLYKNVLCMTPNLNEFFKMSGIEARKDQGYIYAQANVFMSKNNIECLIITLGANGAYVCTPKCCSLVPGYEKEIANTIGAGDTFVATLSASFASGCDWIDATTLANVASSIAVSKKYTNICSFDELKDKLS